MAENINEVAGGFQNLQMNAPANVAPGVIHPYVLPDCDREEPFESIMSFAISESVGPLEEYNLKSFLRRDFDRRRGDFITLVQKFTPLLNEFLEQMISLHDRTNGIKENEKQKNDLLNERIKELIKALRDRSRILDYTSPLNFSNEAREAMLYVGHEGPLTEKELAVFITTGYYQVSEAKLMEQLENFRRRFNDNLAIEGKKYKFIHDKIVKFIDYFSIELVLLRNNI